MKQIRHVSHLATAVTKTNQLGDDPLAPLAPLDFIRLRGQNPGMADEHSRRMDKLEANLAHIEHQVEQLNGVVIEQSKLLERLKKEVQRQSTAMQTMELEHVKANNQKPPHYQ
jgi:uncharacterized coiled-coil protein SlyX